MKNHLKIKTVWPDILLVYLVHQFLVLGSCYFGQNMLAGKKTPLEPLATLLRGLGHWDGNWYLRIANEGYNLKSAAFFPFYPLLIKLLQGMGLTPGLGALLISNLAFFFLLFVLYKLVSLDYEQQIAHRVLWYIALFPTAFFFSVMYTESLYLVLVLLAFYLARGKHWLLACIAAALAGLTRNLGVFLVLPLCYEYWREEKPRLNLAALKAHYHLLYFGLIPTGLFCYMLYLQQTFNKPLAFMEAQRFWRRSFDWPWHSIYQTVLNIKIGNNAWNLVFTVFGLFMLLLVAQKLKPAYTLYMGLGLIIPLFSPAVHSPLLSLPRFVLVLFPMYIALALVVKREQIHWAILCTSTFLLVMFNMLFANSRWVA